MTTTTTRDLIKQRAAALRNNAVRPLDKWFPAAPELAPDQPAPPLVALTVFTEYQLPSGGYGITCVCGEVFLDETRQVARRAVAGHRCSDKLGHPAPLLPETYLQPDTATTDTVERVLLGLRGLL